MVKSIDNSEPAVLSVIMCVYNGEAFLKEAVESVLAQTYAFFEFIVVNDGSTDHTADILASFDDPRMVVITNGANLGLIRSLNIGLAAATGTFIARMDADDICRPERFEKQLAFLKQHPEVGLCGTWLQIIGDDSRYTFPLTHEEIKLSLLDYNPIAHPSVLFRSKVLKEAGLTYDPGFPGAEDYELWSRAILLTRFANLPETLLLYRRHGQQVTQSKQQVMVASSGKIKLNMLRTLGIHPDERESTVHLFLFNGQFKELKGLDILEEADAWLHKLVSANRSFHQFRESDLLALWKSKLLVTCVDRYNLRIWAALKRSRCFEWAPGTIGERSKLFIKCLLRISV
jgi:glycosyltransferase involved in cell wall biosynthesis